MDLIPLTRDWRADWPVELTSAVDKRVLACQHAMIALCMSEISASGRSPIAYFESSYKSRQDGDFLVIVESYLGLDEALIAEIPAVHAQKLRSIVDTAESDIKQMLNDEQAEVFAEQGVQPLLAGLRSAGASDFFCELNDLPTGDANQGSYEEFFCPKPFEYAEIAQRGTTFLCCPVMIPTSVGDAGDGTFMDVWNSAKAQAIRASILDGSYSHCLEKTCPALQQKSLPRRAHITDPYHRAIIDNNVTKLPKGPAEIVMNYDRSCNLACPTCRTDKVVLSGEQKQAATAVQAWATADHLNDAQRLHITGSGDALGSSLFHSFLREFDPSTAPHLRISLGTNAILFTPDTWSRICNEAVDIVVASCDAASPQTYTENRGADFDVLVENLHFIGRLRAAGKLQYFVMNFVVQANNYAEMKDFVELGQVVNADAVMFQQLTNWGPFDNAAFRSRAIHHESHPEHAQFLDMLKDPVFSLPIVDMFNLVDIRQQLPDVDQPTLDKSTAEEVGEIPEGNKDKIAQELLASAVPVVQAYGPKLKAASTLAGSEVLDVSNLDHPKTAVKESLIAVLRSTKDPDEKQMLSSAYVLLAKFQNVSDGNQSEAVKRMDEERLVLLQELNAAGYAV